MCFNAHRVYDPNTVVSFFTELKLISFSFVNDAGNFLENQDLGAAKECDYACGMYTFEK